MSDLKREDDVSKVEKVTRPSQEDSSQQDETASDSKEYDAAAQVLNNYHGEKEWTEAEETKLRKRIDWKLMPILCITYGLQYYDKAMLGQAAIFGLITDLDLDIGDRYSFSAAIFYLGFIAGAYPSMFLAQRYPVERVTSIIVTIWGICLLLTIVCSSYRGLYAQRFFLGVLESGVSPLFMVIVGSWYKKNEQSFRMGIWYSVTGYVSIFSPLVNFGIGHAHGALPSWKYMYIFAGSLTTLWGILLWFVLPPDPAHAKGYDERQRYILVARLRSNNAGVRNITVKWGQLKELALDYRFWLLFFTAMLNMIANGPLTGFLPIIINGFGFSTLNSLLLVMPVAFFAGTGMLVATYLCYKIKNIRTWVILVGQLGTTLSTLLLWKLPLSNTGGQLFACIILPCFGAGYAVLMGLSIANVAGYTKRVASSSGLFIGYCLGNFIGPLLFFEKEAPRYNTGFICTWTTTLAAGILIVIYRYACIAENRKRDKSGVMESYEHAFDDPTDKENKQFRYVL